MNKMNRWTEDEVKKLSATILEKIYRELEPLNEKKILVLCSSEGDVAFWLVKKTKEFKAKVIGLELDDKCLKRSIERLKELELGDIIEFHKAEMYRIPYPDEVFDALISEFIIFPTPVITQIAQNEMARVLKKGGKMILTDIIVTKKLPEDVRNELKLLGLDYLCEATIDHFREWMIDAGLKNVEVIDITPLVRHIWEERWSLRTKPESDNGWHYLLNSEFGLGETIFYIYIRGEKL